jgi:glutamate decarboxylase
MENALANARLLSKSLEATGWYECVSDIHRKKGVFDFTSVQEKVFGKEDETSADYNAGLPVVAFRFSDDFEKQYPHIKQEAVSKLLRVRQYIIPNYPLPPNEEKTEILRVVVRESMSMDLLDRLISDIIAVTQDLMEADGFDLASLQGAATTIEKSHGSQGVDAKTRHKHGSRQPFSQGVHRTVC